MIYVQNKEGKMNVKNKKFKIIKMQSVDICTLLYSNTQREPIMKTWDIHYSISISNIIICHVFHSMYGFFIDFSVISDWKGFPAIILLCHAISFDIQCKDGTCFRGVSASWGTRDRGQEYCDCEKHSWEKLVSHVFTPSCPSLSQSRKLFFEKQAKATTDHICPFCVCPSIWWDGRRGHQN